MTRDDALKDLYDYIEYNRDVGRCDLEESDGVEIINEIYDDFESRTCGNCHYYIEEENGCFIVNNFVDETFGCLKFERKENER